MTSRFNLESMINDLKEMSLNNTPNNSDKQ